MTPQQREEREMCLSQISSVAAAVHIAEAYLEFQCHDSGLTEEEANAVNNFQEMLDKIGEGLAEIADHDVDNPGAPLIG